MSNTITTIANGGNGSGILAGPHHGLKTTISAVPGGTLINGPTLNSAFTFTQPAKDFKAGTITIKGEGNEEAEFDAAFINDLKLLLEVIQEVPDEHPLGDLKHDMRMRRAFKKLGG
jgi:selenocysteine lyase/cysteine desulfurase